MSVRMDPDAVRRVVRNLVDNAVKFCESGRVEVRLWTESEEVVMEVEDEGIGIGEEFKERLYRAFEQESSGLTREYGGVGLGLSITKRIVDRAGGRIELESEKGTGTTFTVRLPTRWKVDQERPSSDIHG